MLVKYEIVVQRRTRWSNVKTASCPRLVIAWSSPAVYDVGPTSTQPWFNVSSFCWPLSVVSGVSCGFNRRLFIDKATHTRQLHFCTDTSNTSRETVNPLALKALKYLYISVKTKGFFQFEIIINVLVSYFRFI